MKLFLISTLLSNIEMIFYQGGENTLSSGGTKFIGILLPIKQNVIYPFNNYFLLKKQLQEHWSLLNLSPFKFKHIGEKLLEIEGEFRFSISYSPTVDFLLMGGGGILIMWGSPWTPTTVLPIPIITRDSISSGSIILIFYHYKKNQFQTVAKTDFSCSVFPILDNHIHPRISTTLFLLIEK